MWKYILTIILIASVTVMLIVKIKMRKKEDAAKLRAASVLLRERQLDRAISRDSTPDPNRIRPVLELRWKDNGKRHYLFDPSMPVRIGKDPLRNNICIRRDDVSSEHCVLIMHRGGLTVQDLNTRNGTCIKRGGKKYRINGRVYVQNGDRLEVGGLSMTIHLFMYDAAYI